jgi:hypothetical protein
MPLRSAATPVTGPPCLNTSRGQHSYHEHSYHEYSYHEYSYHEYSYHEYSEPVLTTC